VIRAGLPVLHPEQARLVIARNTLDLEKLWVSEVLLDEVAAHPMLEQVGPPREMAFDGEGNLTLRSAN
jgi:hypothetical protein